MEQFGYSAPAIDRDTIATPRLMLAVMPLEDWSQPGDARSAPGYVLEPHEPLELLAAIRALSAGVAIGPERIVRKVTFRVVAEGDEGPALFGLSPREIDVLRGLVDGLSYKMVADKLGISFETVRTHVKKVYDKLGVHNCAEAVAKALKSGLLH